MKMPEEIKPFKKPSQKHQPKGLTVLYEDAAIIVVDKVAGLLTMGTEREKLQTAHYLLGEYVKKGNQRSKNRVFIVHRLDRETSGLLIFAKTPYAKKYLQDNWKDFSKSYYAVVHGVFNELEGEYTSYLAENKAFTVYSVKDPEKGKFAQTGYKVLKASGLFSLLEVKLHTGRKHQIRVHMSENGHPLVGDKFYGKPEKVLKQLALHSASLTIKHPLNHQEMTFQTKMPAYFDSLVK